MASFMNGFIFRKITYFQFSEIRESGFPKNQILENTKSQIWENPDEWNQHIIELIEARADKPNSYAFYLI